MTEKQGFRRARGVLHSDEPSICPDCGAELSNGTEQIRHLWRVGCVEVLKAQIADLERQLDEARERMAVLENALGPILTDMDKAKAEGRQYMPIENEG